MRPYNRSLHSGRPLNCEATATEYEGEGGRYLGDDESFWEMVNSCLSEPYGRTKERHTGI